MTKRKKGPMMITGGDYIIKYLLPGCPTTEISKLSGKSSLAVERYFRKRHPKVKIVSVKPYAPGFQFVGP